MSGEASNENPQVARAVDILQSGGLVAFPTETVYGLGADATNARAVRRIFSAKGRPLTNPLIVHVSDANIARRYVRDWPRAANELARRFWPGPLTLVLPKADVIVAEATAGLPSVGVRAPNHAIALELLRRFDGPIAAPSANRVNRISPTTADHVRRELGAAVDLILDGGPCQVGIESTVLDLTAPIPMILRPGAVTRAQLESAIGPVGLLGDSAHGSTTAALSPGRQPVHYSPTAPAWRFEASQTARIVEWLRTHGTESASLILMAQSPTHTSLRTVAGAPHQILLMPPNAVEYAQGFYAALHQADAPGCTGVFIEMPPQDAAWAAIHDRLRRATRPL